MKKILLTIIAIACITVAKAQTEKGTTYLGGSVGFSNNTFKSPVTSDTYNRTLTLAPTVGWFVAKNWSIGITPVYMSTRDSIVSYSGFGGGTSTTVNKTKYLGAGIDVRYYVNITPQFAFFPQLSLGYTGLIGEKNVSGRNMFVGISPNFTYFPTKNWGINLAFGALQYRNSSTTYKAGGTETKVTSNNFDFAANSGMSLGVNYFFGK